MSDSVILRKKDKMTSDISVETPASMTKTVENSMPTLADLKSKLEQSSKLVEDIILKKYLHKLTEFEISLWTKV